MQTLYPDYNQIQATRQKTMMFLHQMGPQVNSTITQFIHALQAIPGFAVEYLPAPECVLRVHTTEDCNVHMMAIHSELINRYNQTFGQYDWLQPGACNFTMNYYLHTGRNGQYWLPYWECRVSVLENPQTSTAFYRIWSEVIMGYLRQHRFIN